MPFSETYCYINSYLFILISVSASDTEIVFHQGTGSDTLDETLPDLAAWGQREFDELLAVLIFSPMRWELMVAFFRWCSSDFVGD